jgi:hypothetical protein
MKVPRALSLPLLVVAVAIGAYLYWSHKRAEEREHQAYVEEGGRLQAAIFDMTSRWNAISDWQDGFKSRRPSTIYTSEVQKAVLGDRPILLYAQLNDIRSAGGGYTVELSSPVTEWFLHMRYSLSCDSDLGRKFFGGKTSQLPIFAIVAHIDHVDKRTEPENSFYFAEGTAKEAIQVGVRGLGLTQSRTGASSQESNAARESSNE